MYARSNDPSARRQLDRVAAHRSTGAAKQRGRAQGEPLMGARGPLLEVRHLHAGGRVDSIGGLDQAREEQGFER